MEKIVIYGIGEHLKNKIENDSSFFNELKNYEIVGLIDKNKCGEKYILNDRLHTIMSLDDWNDLSVDKVFIATNKYSDEIKRCLVNHGFAEQKIYLLDDLYLLKFLDINMFNGKEGVEIGGPTDFFNRIYDTCKKCDGINFSSQTVWWKEGPLRKYIYKDCELGKTYIADATNLENIKNETYDFVLSSNNLEHIANPIKAMDEFNRITKKGGVILVVVPNKDVTFDHNREFTSFEHLLEDYKNNVQEDDLTHLPEILEKHDYDMDIECGGKEAFILRAKYNYENRCLHHHVFNERCLKEMFEYLHIDIFGLWMAQGNFWIIGKKTF